MCKNSHTIYKPKKRAIFSDAATNRDPVFRILHGGFIMIRKAKIFTLILALALAMPIVAQANGLPVFTELAARAGKAVVFISTEKTTQGNPGQQFHQQIPEGHPFREFFEQFDQFFGQQQGQPRKQLGQGSGFVISPDGLIVTNNHVINGADKVSVRFQDDKREYVAEVVGADRETDLAVIKIKADRTLETLSFGDSDAIQVGEWVLAIGNPFGLDNTVTAGIISAKHRIIGAGPFDNFLQTDASINPGNSGGPLLNMRGEVIGINTAINAAAENIGFAIPSTQASKIISQLKAGKSVQRGWLGVTIQQVTETQAKALGLAEAAGALVASVGKDAPADKGGVKQGDVILEVNGQKIEDNTDLLKKIAGLAPGDKVRLGLWSNGKMVTKNSYSGPTHRKRPWPSWLPTPRTRARLQPYWAWRSSRSVTERPRHSAWTRPRGCSWSTWTRTPLPEKKVFARATWSSRRTRRM